MGRRWSAGSAVNAVTAVIVQVLTRKRCTHQTCASCRERRHNELDMEFRRGYERGKVAQRDKQNADREAGKL